MADKKAKSDPFIEAVGRFADSQQLFRPGAGVVAAVSGGADSVALLAVLCELARKPERAYKITVGHFNHELRDDAARDEEFVTELARKWNIPCVVEKDSSNGDSEPLSKLSAEGGGSYEDEARTRRYHFLGRLARDVGAACVAVAHHADDNAETILDRLIRGCHLRGLAGMVPARRLEGAGPCMLIRPFLPFERKRIEAFCRRRGLTWRQDRSNDDRRFRRNFIRHELLPLLRKRMNPRADEALLRLADAAAEVEQFLSAEAGAVYEQVVRPVRPDALAIDAAALARRPALMRKYVFRLALERLEVPLRGLSAARMAQLAELVAPAGPEAGSLPGGYEARREGSQIIIAADTAEAATCPPHACQLDLHGETAVGEGGAVICEVMPFDAKAFEAHRAGHSRGVEWLDAQKIDGGRLTFRPRCSGDAFVPLGAPGTKSVSDFLTDRKLPRSRRDLVRCICDAKGIVYLAPLRIAERVRITGATRRVLRITVCMP